MEDMAVPKTPFFKCWNLILFKLKSIIYLHLTIVANQSPQIPTSLLPD
jgi:hypothetical protein